MVADKVMQFPVKSPYDPSTAAMFADFPQPTHGPVWLNNVRADAWEKFKEYGLPTVKLERWKYTNLPAFVKNLNVRPFNMDVQVSSDRPYAQHLVTMAERNEQWLAPLMMGAVPGEEKYGDMALWYLNTAFLRFGLMIDIPDGRIVEEPIEIKAYADDGQFAVPRIVIRMGRGAKATIIEKMKGKGAYWKNSVTQIVQEENSHLEHCRLLEDSGEGVFTQSVHFRLARDCTYKSFTLDHGAGISRRYVHAQLLGPNIDFALNGLNLLKDKRHAEVTYLVEHEAPHCTSSQFIRSLVADEAHGVFQGKVHVHQEAQKTDGYQLSNAILLSDKAQMDTKPELEIYADDVKCSHGATTGQLDDEPIFYLRSRGLSEAQARMLMLQSFTAEVLEKIGDAKFRGIAEEKVEKWLQSVL